MKRAAIERARTLATWKRHLSLHAPAERACRCEQQPGRFRKGERAGGCGRPRCWLCHGDKLAGLPRPGLRRALAAEREGLRELAE